MSVTRALGISALAVLKQSQFIRLEHGLSWHLTAASEQEFCFGQWENRYFTLRNRPLVPKLSLFLVKQPFLLFRKQ